MLAAQPAAELDDGEEGQDTEGGGEEGEHAGEPSVCAWGAGGRGFGVRGADVGASRELKKTGG